MQARRRANGPFQRVTQTLPTLDQQIKKTGRD